MVGSVGMIYITTTDVTITSHFERQGFRHAKVVISCASAYRVQQASSKFSSSTFSLR